MEKTAQPRPFGLRDKIGYLFGDFGNDFTFILSTVILSKFYTDVMGVSAGVVGTVMMLARAVDAVTDLSMGRLCDRSRPTPVGKFKPWLLRLCVPVAAASFLLYQSGFAGRPMGFKIAYLAVTYILWGSFCYTGINIPYGSMASAISPEPADRQSLSTFRTMGGMLAFVRKVKGTAPWPPLPPPWPAASYRYRGSRPAARPSAASRRSRHIFSDSAKSR